MPFVYYRNRLFLLERHRWIHIFDHSETTRILVKFEQESSIPSLWTKAGWADFCLARGIRTVPIAAHAKQGTLRIIQPQYLQSGQDIFLKPNKDYSARGGIMLEWSQAPAGWQADGACEEFIAADGLEAFLKRLSLNNYLIVQPRMRNADSLSNLTLRALLNVRIVTILSPHDGISILTAGLRIPPGDQPTSDVLGSTMSVSIDPETGVLDEALSAVLSRGSNSIHPHNGAQIKGRHIPEWSEMKAMAIDAHRQIPDMPTIGWDLIATTEGVFILEANAVWSGYLGQHWGSEPLGETIWPEVMLSHWKR